MRHSLLPGVYLCAVGLYNITPHVHRQCTRNLPCFSSLYMTVNMDEHEGRLLCSAPGRQRSGGEKLQSLLSCGG